MIIFRRKFKTGNEGRKKEYNDMKKIKENDHDHLYFGKKEKGV